MEEEILQFIGNYGVVGLLLFFSIKEFFNWLGKKNGNGNGTNILQKELNIISENHLNHIEQAIREQTEQNNKWHQEQYKVLCEIKGILEKK